MSNKINEDLFKTNAVRVAPEQTPFWYTSGRLGPFYINTHFIVKDEENAVRLLKNIESYIAEDKLTAPRRSLMICSLCMRHPILSVIVSMNS